MNVVEATINGVKSELIAQRVEKLERAEGQCHPRRLWETAKAKRDPLHDAFEWDDRAGAEQWRTEQARQIMRRLRVVVEGRDEPMPAVVHVRTISDDGVSNGYVSTVRALSTDMREGVVSDALKQLEGIRTRYNMLAELGPVWDAIEEVTDRKVAA